MTDHKAPAPDMTGRPAEIAAGDASLLSLAREYRAVSHANDVAFWEEAERLHTVAREGPVSGGPRTPSTAVRPSPGVLMEFSGEGGVLTRVGVAPRTLWEGPFDLTWLLAAIDEVGGVPVRAGREILRSADPAGAFDRVVLVGSAMEGVAHAQAAGAARMSAIYVAVRGAPTPALTGDVARVLATAVGGSVRPLGGVVAAFPLSAHGAEWGRVSRLCVPAGVAWTEVAPPGGRRTWQEALAPDLGRGPARADARGKRGMGVDSL